VSLHDLWSNHEPLAAQYERYLSLIRQPLAITLVITLLTVKRLAASRSVRRNSLSNQLLSVLGLAQAPNNAFAWKRIKKFLGNCPICSSVSQGKPVTKTGSSHQGGRDPFQSKGKASGSRVNKFCLNPSISRAISRRPGPRQGRRNPVEPSRRDTSAASTLDRVAGGNTMGSARRGSARIGRHIHQAGFRQAPSGRVPFSRYFQRVTQSAWLSSARCFKYFRKICLESLPR
jgi:hypothetical protein